MEARRLYTMGGAYAQYRENEVGSIEPGRRADFIVLDEDIFDVPIEGVRRTRVEQTHADGVRVIEANHTADLIDF